METSRVASGSTVVWRRSSPALLGSDPRTITSRAFPRRRRGATPPSSPRHLRWSGYSTPLPALDAPRCVLRSQPPLGPRPQPPLVEVLLEVTTTDPRTTMFTFMPSAL